MEENEKIFNELKEIKELLKEILEETKWVNDNIATATEKLRKTTIAWGS